MGVLGVDTVVGSMEEQGAAPVHQVWAGRVQLVAVPLVAKELQVEATALEASA